MVTKITVKETDFGVAALTDIATLQSTAAAKPANFVIACSDETTPLTVGTNKTRFRAPHAFTIASVKCSLTTASSSGLVTVDVNKNGVSIFSTRPTLDVSEKTTATAATPSVLSTTAVAADDELTFDVDVAGTNASGLKVTLVLA
ncbi:MAG: hypothetical protein ABL886_06800 [Rhodoglobus sp.]